MKVRVLTSAGIAVRRPTIRLEAPRAIAYTPPKKWVDKTESHITYHALESAIDEIMVDLSVNRGVNHAPL